MITAVSTSALMTCLRCAGSILLAALTLGQFGCSTESRMPGPDIRIGFTARAHVMRKEFVRASKNESNWKWIHEDTSTMNIKILIPWVWLTEWPAISSDGWYHFYQRLTYGTYTLYGVLSHDRGSLKNFGFQYYTASIKNDNRDSIDSPFMDQAADIRLSIPIALSDSGGVRYWSVKGSDIPAAIDIRWLYYAEYDRTFTTMYRDSLLEMKYDDHSVFSIEFRWPH